MENKKPIGSVKDIRCKANVIVAISRKVCRNNCKYWKHKKNKNGVCTLGY